VLREFDRMRASHTFPAMECAPIGTRADRVTSDRRKSIQRLDDAPHFSRQHLGFPVPTGRRLVAEHRFNDARTSPLLLQP